MACNGHLILCIDERPANLMSDREVLKSAGYNVAAAMEPAEALHVMRTCPVDLVLVADSLRSDRYALCAELRRIEPDVCLVYQKASFCDVCDPAEADLIIAKTTDPSEKLAAIAALLQKQLLRKQTVPAKAA